MIYVICKMTFGAKIELLGRSGPGVTCGAGAPTVVCTLRFMMTARGYEAEKVTQHSLPVTPPSPRPPPPSQLPQTTKEQKIGVDRIL